MRRGAVALAFLAALGAACSGSSDEPTSGPARVSPPPEALSPEPVSPEPVSPPSVPPATVEWRTFVDPTRPTPAADSVASRPDRTIEVRVRLPESIEPRPLVVFGHGIDGHPRNLSRLLDAWQQAGFVVAAPLFPLSNDDIPGALTNSHDIAGQVGDISFVVDSLLADPTTAPRIDGDRIAVAGHSLGGLAVATAALGVEADARIAGAIVMSAGFLADPAAASLPTMVVHGVDDPVVPLVVGTTAHATLTGPSWMVALVGGGHLTGIVDDDTATGGIVREVTTAFLDLVLDGAPSSRVDDAMDDAVSAGLVAADG